MSVSVRTFATAAEAAEAASRDRAARFLGGGTLLMRAVNEGDRSFSALVRSTDPALAEVRAEGGRIVLGAGATMAAILARPELDFLHPAARAVGGPAIRNMATVGGNLFAPHPYGDFATALLALDAEAALAGGRTVPLAELLRARGQGPREVVLSVSLARPPAGAFRFAKASRVRPAGAAVVTVAACLPTGGGVVRGARVAWGAMGPAPLRATAVERALEGRRLDEEGVAPALAAAAEGTAPPSDALASEWYRREVAPVHLGRLLLGGGEGARR